MWQIFMMLAAAPGSLAVGLPEGQAVQGIERAAVTRLAGGENNAFPALAVTPGGVVLVAFVRLENGRETIWLREAPSPRGKLGPARPVSWGPRAWHPRLAAGPDGTVWLSWSGRRKRGRRGSHAREVFLRRVHPGRLGRVMRVSRFGGRAADPQLAVGEDGRVHLVWEQSPPGKMDRVRIGYRALAPRSGWQAEPEIISPGPFDRRPAVVVSGSRIQAAWDSLVDRKVTGACDPDYDVFARARTRSGWEPVRAIDTRPGIQAAPSLLVDRKGCLLVAFHSSHRYGLVKWWDLRRVCRGKLQGLAARDPAAGREPSGEQQGAEFPALAGWPDGKLAVVTRPSQGAYLQLVDGSGISPPLDLTRRGWGARGMRAQAVVGPDGTLLVVRRARHACVLERFRVRRDPAGLPAFGSLMTPGQKPVQAVPKKTAGSPAALYGDVHMHSAASDGTGPPDEIYARAWVRGLDFAVLTDHDYVAGSPRFPSSFEEIAWVTDAFDARGGFSTLHAWEWTTRLLPKGYGHRNVYFRGPAPVSICSAKGACPDPASLFAHLQGEPALVIPHHTSWTGTDWGGADPALQRQFEIVSIHGASEYPDNQPIPPRGNMSGMFAVDGLKRGLRFGFVGGSDSHGLLWHHGIARQRDPWVQGLTGIPGPPENSRADVFDALRARNTFATSGPAWPLVLEAKALEMGMRGRLAAPVELHFESAGYDRIELVRDGTVIHGLAVDPAGFSGGFSDARAEPGDHYYYLRATAGQGKSFSGMAWTSPVFVTVTERK